MLLLSNFSGVSYSLKMFEIVIRRRCPFLTSGVAGTWYNCERRAVACAKSLLIVLTSCSPCLRDKDLKIEVLLACPASWSNLSDRPRIFLRCRGCCVSWTLSCHDGMPGCVTITQNWKIVPEGYTSCGNWFICYSRPLGLFSI